MTSTFSAGEKPNVPEKVTLWFHYQPRLSATISCQTTGFTWNCYIIHTHTHTNTSNKVAAVVFHSNRPQQLHYVIMLFYSVCTVCLIPTKDLLAPSVSVPASLWVWGMRISALLFCQPSCVSLSALWWALLVHHSKQVSAPLDKHLRNSLFAPVAVLTGPSASHPFGDFFVSVCLSVCRYWGWQ